jgi:hypothetical protein
MASYKDYKNISAAKKAGSMYYTDKNGKKALAVTKEQLDSWKKKNKGKFKGSALTAWANAKGKNIADKKAPATKPKAKPSTPGSKRPPKRPLGAPTLRERNPIKTETLLPGSDKTLEDVLKNTDKKSASRGPSKRPRRSPSSLSPNEKKLRDWKAGEKNLSMKEQGRLRKWALRNNKSVPKDLYSTPDNYK